MKNFLHVDAIHHGFMHGLSHDGQLYICESCILCIEGWEKAERLKGAWFESYGQAKNAGADDEQPAAAATSCKVTHDGRKKRMAKETPEKPVRRSRLSFDEPTTDSTSTASSSQPPQREVHGLDANALSPAMSRLTVSSDVSSVEVGFNIFMINFAVFNYDKFIVSIVNTPF